MAIPCTGPKGFKRLPSRPVRFPQETFTLLKGLALLAIAILSGTACSNAPEVVPVSGEAGGAADNTIYIASHGWHTGIIFPRQKLLELLPGLRSRFESGDYLEVGWGDTGFYQAQKITSGLTLGALLWPTDSIVHVVSVRASPVKSFPQSEVRKLCLTKPQLDSLGAFLRGSFKRDETGSVIRLSRGIYGDSQFYAGEGSYHLFNTCNKWTAKGLKSAGFDIALTFKLTASSIMDNVHPRDSSTCH